MLLPPGAARGPPARPVSAPPETVSPVLPDQPVLLLCREASLSTSLARAPQNLLLQEARRARPSKEKGTHLAGRALSSPARGCQLRLRCPCPGASLSPEAPLSTSRHDLKPKLTGMNAWLPPLLLRAASLGLSPSHADVARPAGRPGAKNDPQKAPGRPAALPKLAPLWVRSCQAPDVQGDPWPTPRKLPCTPLPHLPPVTPPLLPGSRCPR